MADVHSSVIHYPRSASPWFPLCVPETKENYGRCQWMVRGWLVYLLGRSIKKKYIYTFFFYPSPKTFLMTHGVYLPRFTAQQKQWRLHSLTNVSALRIDSTACRWPRGFWSTTLFNISLHSCSSCSTLSHSRQWCEQAKQSSRSSK